MCVFQRKTGHISETVRDTAKVTFNRQGEMAYAFFQMKWKLSTLDNFEGHWQPVRSAILATAGLFVYRYLKCHTDLFDVFFLTFLYLKQFNIYWKF